MMNSFVFLLCFLIFYVVTERASFKIRYDPLKYNTFDKIENRLLGLNSTLVGYASLESIGTTYYDNSIWQITLSNGLSYRKPVVWIDCGIQGRDWLTHSTCMYIVDSIASHLLHDERNDDIGQLLIHYNLVVIPVVNPDGYIQSWTPWNRSWAKNTYPGIDCDGVFISQNFRFKFGSAYSDFTECDYDYVGPMANTEEETLSITNSLQKINKSVGVFAIFHLENNGKKWMYPWSYTTLSSPTVQSLEIFCAEAVSAIRKISTKEYTCGQAANLDRKRGGTFIDYAHSDLGILTIYLVAVREGSPSSPFDVPEEEIENTGKEILGGILAAVGSKRKFQNCIYNNFDNNEYNQYSKIEKHLTCIGEILESKVKLESIGKTFNKNEIWMMTFSKDFQEEKGLVLIDCGMQARDWITHSTCIYIIDAVVNHFLVEKDRIVDDLLDNFDLMIIPVVNPDGYIKSWTPYNRQWTKNVNEDGGYCDGVFISQNFPFMFTSTYSNVNECDFDYIGFEPISEMETKALTEILSSLRERLFIVFHLESYGQKWMYPFSYTKDPSYFVDCLERNCQSAIRAIFRATAKQYSCSQISNGEGITRGGTFIDFIHQELEIPLVYSLSLRTGENNVEVAVDEIAETGNEIWKGILAAVENAVLYPCELEFTIRPIPATKGPANE